MLLKLVKIVDRGRLYRSVRSRPKWSLPKLRVSMEIVPWRY